MRVFLFQTAIGLFSSSGGYKANICLLRHLASRGHRVRQLCYSYPGEAEAYFERMGFQDGCEPDLRKSVLHLRAQDGGSGTDVEVSHFTMDDGIEIVALDRKAFDTAFNMKKTWNEISREKANYIEVISWNPPLEIVTSLTHF